MEPIETTQLKPDVATETNKPVYEPPQIIYEGLVTTRAGTPEPPRPGDGGVDPADLFGK